MRANLKSETALKAAATHGCSSRSPPTSARSSRASRRRGSSATRRRCSTSTRSTSRSPATARRRSSCSTPTSRSATSPSISGSNARNALDGKTANVVATLRGTVEPRSRLRRQQPLRLGRSRAGRRRRLVGDGGAAGSGARPRGPSAAGDGVFASFTGEEGGLLGSREFVRRAVAGKLHVVGALNNDMIGWMNDGRLDNTIRYSNPGIRDIQHGAAMLFTRLITYDALYFKGTDAASLYDAYGDVIGGIGSYPVLGSPHYHQAERSAGVREPPAHHRNQQDDGRDGDAAGVEPVAADEPEGGQLHWRGRVAVVDAGPGAGHRVVHRRLRAAGRSAAPSRRP